MTDGFFRVMMYLIFEDDCNFLVHFERYFYFLFYFYGFNIKKNIASEVGACVDADANVRAVSY